jgi:hypothetical protein
MSKNYEVTVTYQGGIYLEANSEDEALAKAQRIFGEEINDHDMAKYAQYEIEKESNE